MIRLFGLAQAFRTQVLFPVDVEPVGKEFLAETLVDRGVQASEFGIGLFHVDDRGVRVERFAQSEGFHPPVD